MDTRPNPKFVDLRANPRIKVPFPALVRGVDSEGNHFETETVIDDLSTTGLRFRVGRTLVPGVRLLIGIWLSGNLDKETTKPQLILHADVERITPVEGGVYDLGLKVIHHRFF